MRITQEELAVLRLDMIEARDRYRWRGMMNTPTDYNERLKSQVEYQQVYEDYRRAEAAYERALEQMIDQDADD